VPVRVLTYNICRGGTGKEDQIAAVIAAVEPDITVFQEATVPAVVEHVATRMGMGQWAASKGESLAFMSRRPVRHFEWHHPRLSRHAFLEIEPGPGELRIFGLHLSALYSAWTERHRVIELRNLLASIARHQHGFHLLAGDFNTLAPGDMLDFRKLPRRLRALVWLSGGTIRWKTIRLVLDAGYADAYRLIHGAEVGHTFPSWAPHVRLDYFFTPSGFANRVRQCEIVHHPAAAVASDHLPLLVDVEFA
jgi:endonuclease/exonuclease/phosphatase family metal-dependent hydrolase